MTPSPPRWSKTTLFNFWTLPLVWGKSIPQSLIFNAWESCERIFYKLVRFKCKYFGNYNLFSWSSSAQSQMSNLDQKSEHYGQMVRVGPMVWIQTTMAAMQMESCPDHFHISNKICFYIYTLWLKMDPRSINSNLKKNRCHTLKNPTWALNSIWVKP